MIRHWEFATLSSSAKAAADAAKAAADKAVAAKAAADKAAADAAKAAADKAVAAKAASDKAAADAAKAASDKAVADAAKAAAERAAATSTGTSCSGWQIGDGIGGGEKQLGMVADRAACVALVRARYKQICIHVFCIPLTFVLLSAKSLFITCRLLCVCYACLT